MTLIDHRILVHAPPEIVWEQLTDFAATHKWQANCTQASILTTQQTGKGVRVRLNMKRGTDHVMEIVSWYNNLGYEYTIIEGPFDENSGRIRMQVIPEGTVVQWTFEYQTRGFGSGLRNRLSLSRQTEQTVSDSLKQLKQLVEAKGIRMDAELSNRVALRPAPSAKERAQMSEDISRSMAKVTAEPEPSLPEEISPSEDLSVPEPAKDLITETQPIEAEEIATNIVEPPVSKDDTKPNEAIPVPAIAVSNDDEITAIEPQPTLIDRIEDAQSVVLHEDYEEPPTIPQITELDETPSPIEDAEVVAPRSTIEPDKAPAEETPPPALIDDLHPIETATEISDTVDTPTTEETLPTSEKQGHADDESPIEPAPVKLEPEPPLETSSASHESLLEKQLDPMGPSIWEVFGMAAPSEQAQEQPTANASVETDSPAVAPEPAPTGKKHTSNKPQLRSRQHNKNGLRITQARARVRQRS